jgi:hypothetical protein
MECWGSASPVAVVAGPIITKRKEMLDSVTEFKGKGQIMLTNPLDDKNTLVGEKLWRLLDQKFDKLEPVFTSKQSQIRLLSKLLR